MLLKGQIASALPPHITSLHGADHCRHFKAFWKRIFGAVLGCIFNHCVGAIKALLLVLVARVAGAHSGAIFSPFQAPFRCYLNAAAGASFNSWRCHIQALFTVAASAGFKRLRRPFWAPFNKIQSTIQPPFQACEWGNRATLRWMQPIPLAMACMALLGMKESTGGWKLGRWVLCGEPRERLDFQWSPLTKLGSLVKWMGSGPFYKIKGFVYWAMN